MNKEKLTQDIAKAKNHKEIAKVKTDAILEELKDINEFIKSGKTYKFTKPITYFYDKNNNPIGLSVFVEVFDAEGNKLDIDPHRVFINPPTSMVVRKWINEEGKPEREVIFNPKETFFYILEQSISEVPHPRKK